jgi:hypothetical protein
MPSPPGHPAHQMRPFTVTVRRNDYPPMQVRVTAQTQDDAVLRAGMILAAGGAARLAAEWIVIGVEDPAPRTWTPPRAGRRG